MQKSKEQIIKEVQSNLETLSPQIQVDADNGPFYYLAARAVAQPLADENARAERLTQLASFNFPAVATADEVSAALRSFGATAPRGGFVRGVALFLTSRRPIGTEAFYVREGDIVGTATSGGVLFAAVETRALTANNADKFYNPATRRYELPVRVQALSVGVQGRIAATTLRIIRSGAGDFEAVTNVARFRGGASAATQASAYAAMQAKLPGLDRFSKGGLINQVLQYDADNVLACAMTTSASYPSLFYRIPDGPSVDLWVLSSPVEETRIESTIVATATQSVFPLTFGPAIGLITVTVNGASVVASLEVDDSLAVGRSTREASKVVLETPAVFGDIVDISYSYDVLIDGIQKAIQGNRTAATGDIFGCDVLVRYARTLNVTYEIRGTALAGFDPSTVAAEVDAVASDYIANGEAGAPLLGGVRSPDVMVRQIRSLVPGVDRLNVVRFARKEYPSLVETISIPPHSTAGFELASDRSTRFT